MAKLLWISTLIITMAACHGNGKLMEEGTPSLTFETQTVTEQSVFPGVYSNLRMTKSFCVNLTGVEVGESIELKSLIPDSLMLPITSLVVNEMRMRRPYILEAGSYTHIAICATQNFYQSEAPEQVTEEKYEASPYSQDANGSMLLEVIAQGQSELVRIDPPTVLDPIYGQ